MVKPDRVPADRPEPLTLATNALVEDVVLDLVKLVGEASAGLGHRCHDWLDVDIEQLHRGQDAATFHGGITGDVQSENRMPSTAREQARAHDEMQGTAGVDPKAFADLPDEIGHDATDMARLDDEALVWVAGKGRRQGEVGRGPPSSFRIGKRASFRLKCSQVNASPKLPGADSASPWSTR